MKYETFAHITMQLQKQEQVINNLYKNNVDLLEFVDPYHQVISTLLEEVYGKEGLDLWSWFCYENDFGLGELEAWDADKKPICYDLKSLWEFLESLRTKP